MNEELDAIDRLLIGRVALLKKGAKPAGWDEGWSDCPDIDSGQITDLSHETGGSVEIGGWWYNIEDVTGLE